VLIPGKVGFEPLREFNVALLLRCGNQCVLPFAGFFALSNLRQCQRHRFRMLRGVIGSKNALC
jgi:hypothetical protein